MRRLQKMILATAAAVLLAGCGDGGTQSGGPGGMPPMPVETATVMATGMADRFSVIGTLEAENGIEVVAETAASVLELPFREGDELAAGDMIARLDDAQLLAEVQRAEALVQQRRATHTRVQTLVREQAGAAQDLDDAAADLAVAEANLAVALARLDKAHILAPFAGIVGARRVSPGAYLQPGDIITDLAQIDRLRATFSVPEAYLGRLAVGAPVWVRTAAYPDLEIVGTVDVINPVLDRATRSARVVAHVVNEGGRLRPGMSAEITVVLDERPGALTIPTEAIFFQGQQAFVYTVAADSAVTMAPVVLGTRSADVVEVTGGLDAGQTVVRAGHQKLFPGARVMPVGAGGPEAPGSGASGAPDSTGGDAS